MAKKHQTKAVSDTELEDAPDVDVDVDADADAVEVDADAPPADHDAPVADADVPSKPATEFEAEPEPGLTMLNLALIVLNIAAAVGFAYLLLLDFAARHKFQRAIALYQAAADGLPLKSQEERPLDISRTQKPRRLSSEDIDDAAKLRKVDQKGAGNLKWQPFVGTMPLTLRPSDLGDEF